MILRLASVLGTIITAGIKIPSRKCVQRCTQYRMLNMFTALKKKN